MVMNNCCCCVVIVQTLSCSLQPHGRQPTRLLCPWDSPGRNGGLPFPSLGDLPNPGIKPMSTALSSGFFTTKPPEKPHEQLIFLKTKVRNTFTHRALDTVFRKLLSQQLTNQPQITPRRINMKKPSQSVHPNNTAEISAKENMLKSSRKNKDMLSIKE